MHVQTHIHTGATCSSRKNKTGMWLSYPKDHPASPKLFQKFQNGEGERISQLPAQLYTCTCTYYDKSYCRPIPLTEKVDKRLKKVGLCEVEEISVG